MGVTVRSRLSHLLAALVLLLAVVAVTTTWTTAADAGIGPTDSLEQAPAVSPSPVGADRLLAAPLVIVGVGGLGWDEISPARTPTLWRLLGDGAAAGAVTVHTLGEPPCPSGGWLSLSAGRSAASDRFGGFCLSLPAVSSTATGGATVANWSELAADQADTEFGPRLGVLGSALAAAGVCATAIGPGAAIALADVDGKVARYEPTVTPAAFGCPVTVVDVGDTSLLNGLDDGALPVDARVAAVLALVPAEATVLVTSVATTAGTRLRMGVALAVGPQVNATYLSTASTRWSGVVRLLDLPPSVLEAVRVDDPPDFQGSAVVQGEARGDARETVRVLGDVTVVDRALRATSGPMTTVLSAVALVLLGALWRRPRTGPASPRARICARALRGATLIAAVFPVSAYLVTLLRWWRFDRPQLALVVGMLAITVVLAAAVALVRWSAPSQPVLVIAAVSALVMAVDVVVGSPLHRGSPFGPSPLLGGRYYGFGNTTYSLFAVYAVVVAGLLAAKPAAAGRSRLAALIVAVVGSAAVLVDIWPTWGADVGGGLALVPAFVVLALGVVGLEVTRLRAVAAVAAGGLIVAAVSVLDWLRPADSRSHAGRFVQQVIDGDATAIVVRKGGYALESLTRGPISWLTVVVLVFLVAALLQPGRFAPPGLAVSLDRWPLLRTVFMAALVGLVLGSLANDYGIRIATIGAMAGAPLLAFLVVFATDHPVAAVVAGPPEAVTPTAGTPEPTESPIAAGDAQRASADRTVERSTTSSTTANTASASVPDSTPPTSEPTKSAVSNRTPTR